MRPSSLHLALLILVGISGCAEDRVPEKYEWMREIGRETDTVAAGIDDYGTISMSSPLLTKPNPSFAFGLKRTGQQYYDDARKDINGAEGRSEQSVTITQAGASAQVNLEDVVRSAAALATGGAAGLVTSAKPGGSGPTTLPAIDPNVLPALVAAQVLNNSKFSPAGDLIKGENLALANREAVITAAGDSVTQGLLEFLSNPTTAEQFKDKIVLLGVAMVTVNPGHRTYRGYVADISVSVSYGKQPLRRGMRNQIFSKLTRVTYSPESLNDTTQPACNVIESAFGPLQTRQTFGSSEMASPLVAAVSPMSEAQTLDLTDSLRRRREAALKLALAL